MGWPVLIAPSLPTAPQFAQTWKKGPRRPSPQGVQGASGLGQCPTIVTDLLGLLLHAGLYGSEGIRYHCQILEGEGAAAMRCQ